MLHRLEFCLLAGPGLTARARAFLEGGRRGDGMLSEGLLGAAGEAEVFCSLLAWVLGCLLGQRDGEGRRGRNALVETDMGVWECRGGLW